MQETLFSKKTGKAEITALLLYVVSVIVISTFHEPWFDEAQAWQIARCASLKELVFTIPHYEGHPQLWHLILAPFAKAGLPFHATAGTINILFCTLAMWLILFRSPFPKLVRCMIPFSYFFFYQYAVLSRPYSLMMTAMFLSAMTYTERNRKPVRHVLSLGLLCMTSAYGIIFAGGLCLVWAWELIQEYQTAHKWNRMLSDRRFFSLLGLLILAMFLIFSIIPAKDNYYPKSEMTFLEYLERIYYYLTVPADGLFTSYTTPDVQLQTVSGLVIVCLAGAVVWAVMILLTRKNKKTAVFCVPYLLFLTFCVFRYMSEHHIGISTMFFIFLFWIMLDQPAGMQMPEMFITLWNKLDSKLIRTAVKLAGFFLLASPVFYAFASYSTEIREFYGPLRIVNFIKANHLEDKNLMITWQTSADNIAVKKEDYSEEVLPVRSGEETASNYPYLTGFGPVCCSYFDKNIFMNFNTDNPSDTFVWHQSSPEKNENLMHLWQEAGLPDFIFGVSRIEDVYTPEQLKDVTYYWIDTAQYGLIWKNSYLRANIKIYIRGDLLDDYPQFEPITYLTTDIY